MRHRKPRFAHYELTRLSIAELKTLLTTANGNGRTTTSIIPRSIMDKQSLIDYLVQQDCIELVRTNTEQVSYRLSDLQHLYSIKQLRQIMNDAGVFYDRKLVVEKEDMIRIFIASGRLLLLLEEPEPPPPQQPPTVETVHSDDEADDDNNDEHYHQHQHQHHHRGHRESSPSPRRHMHQVMEEVSPAGPPDDSHHGPSPRRGADVVEQPQQPQQECGATPLAPLPPPLPSAPAAQSFMEYLLEQVGTLGTTELAMLHETICQLLEDRNNNGNNSNNSNGENNNHNNHDQR
jgi:ABC-type Zn2+ transport system substrate-binding protein/surface adhesin